MTKVTFDISPLCSMLVSGFCFISVNVYLLRIRGKPAKKRKKEKGIDVPTMSKMSPNIDQVFFTSVREA